MIVRFRTPEGTFRITADENGQFSAVIEELSSKLANKDAKSYLIGTSPTDEGQPATTIDGQLSTFGIKHGDMIFVRYSDAARAASAAGTSATEPSSSVKQLAVDDLLDAKDGKIVRKRSPLCRHGDKGMCDYCMPLEPYDSQYQQEHSIKHLSFHGYLNKLGLSKANKATTTMSAALLTPPFYGVLPKCPSGHAPWPASICSKCQPSAITLQQQEFRMVDHVEFASPSIVDSFIDAWRRTGCQRIGYLYGTYEPHDAVPLGVKAVVQAIYEPEQQDETDGVALAHPLPQRGNAHDAIADKAARLCGLTRVGVIFTDLQDAGAGDGSVLCKRHAKSYFVSSLEICFSATLQQQHPNPCRWSDSGYYSSKFVSCVVSGNTDGQIDVFAYQVSTAAEAMVKANLIEASTNPAVVRIMPATATRYVPEVFYTKMNEYNRAVQVNAQPSFPDEYLLVTLTHGFPADANHALFAAARRFPVENRGHAGQAQESAAVISQLGLKSHECDEENLADFHLLMFLLTLGVLSEAEEALLGRAIGDKGLVRELVRTPGWQTLLMVVGAR